MDDLIEQTTRAIAEAIIQSLEARLAKAEAERDAIEAETLERAAKMAEQWLDPIMATPHENSTYRSIALAIRNLINNKDAGHDAGQ